MILRVRATRGLRRMGRGAARRSFLLAERARRTVWLLPLRQGEENRKALAWANGMSRRASGWTGEKVARSRRSISSHL